MERRRFLKTAALTGAGLVAAKGAGAFSIEALDSDAQAAYDACTKGTQAFHDKIIAEVEAQLGGDALTPEQRQKVLSAIDCPVCGCRISELVSADQLPF